MIKATVAAAGYELYLDQRIVKAGGLITSHERRSLTKQQVEASQSDYIFQIETWMGTKYVDAFSPTICYSPYINDPRDDTLVNA